jgi:hypothetical protein
MKIHTVEELAKLPPDTLLTIGDEWVYRWKPMVREPYAPGLLANIFLNLDYRPGSLLSQNEMTVVWRPPKG